MGTSRLLLAALSGWHEDVRVGYSQSYIIERPVHKASSLAEIGVCHRSATHSSPRANITTPFSVSSKGTDQNAGSFSYIGTNIELTEQFGSRWDFNAAESVIQGVVIALFGPEVVTIQDFLLEKGNVVVKFPLCPNIDFLKDACTVVYSIVGKLAPTLKGLGRVNLQG